MPPFRSFRCIRTVLDKNRSRVPACKKGRWEGGSEIAEQRRQIGVSQIVFTGIQGDRVAGHVVDAKICVE